MIWMSSAFAAVTLEKHYFAIQIQFTSVMNSDSWTLVNVYGPSQGLDRNASLTGLLILILELMIVGSF